MSQSLQGMRECCANISKEGPDRGKSNAEAKWEHAWGARDEEHEEMVLERQECQTV